MDKDLDKFMKIAIQQARESLRQGDCGFGSVIFKDGEIVSAAHDTEKTDSDPTAHAEILAIRQAAKTLGRNLSGCTIISRIRACNIPSQIILPNPTMRPSSYTEQQYQLRLMASINS